MSNLSDLGAIFRRAQEQLSEAEARLEDASEQIAPSNASAT